MTNERSGEVTNSPQKAQLYDVNKEAVTPNSPRDASDGDADQAIPTSKISSFKAQTPPPVKVQFIIFSYSSKAIYHKTYA